MAVEGDILDPSWMCWEGPFEEQVNALFSFVRLTRDQVDGLRCLFKDIEDTLRTNWPECEVIPFGSIVTGLGIKTSDVDCFVEIPDWYKKPGDKLVNTARNVLKKRRNIFTQLLAISGAKVPIVKLLHVPTRRNCDLSFKSPSGVRNSKLICYLLHLDRRAHHLAILVKYWSKVHNLTGTNLLANYALSLLVIFYLQHLRVLPPVSMLQDDVPHYFVDNWNTAFSEYFHENDNTLALYEMLGGFFVFYSNYKFDENIVSTYLGYSIVRDSFVKHSDVPLEFGLYRENLKRRVCMPLKLDTAMCVQDPFDHSRNCTVGVFPKLAWKICEYFRLAAAVYGRESSGRFLRLLMTAQPRVAAVVPRIRGKLQNKVVKPIRAQQNFKNVKKNLQRNLHTLYAELNRREKQ